MILNPEGTTYIKTMHATFKDLQITQVAAAVEM